MKITTGTDSEQVQAPTRPVTPSAGTPTGPGIGYTQNQQQYAGSQMIDLTDFDLSSHIDGSTGARADSVLKDIEAYRKETGTSGNGWRYECVTSPDLPNQEMVIAYLLINGVAYVHPVLFADIGGRIQATSNYGQMGQHNQLQEIPSSSASIVRTDGFKSIVLEHLGARVADIREISQIAICGCTLYHKSESIAINNLIGNASTDVFAIYCGVSGAPHKSTIPVSEYSGRSFTVDSASFADKVNIHGQPVFSPVTLTSTIKVNSKLGDTQGSHAVPFGEVCGYMDFTAIAPEVRRQAEMKRLASNNPQRVPTHKPFYVVTDALWAGFGRKSTTPENVLALLSTLPAIADPSLWVGRVINAAESRFNPMYDFAAVGYDEPDFHAPMTDCHVPTKFGNQEMVAYGNDYFDSVSILIDLPTAGPNSGSLGLLKSTSQVNRLLSNLLGREISIGGIGLDFGLIPMGTYDWQGKRRDIRELLNYYSWATFCNGDTAQLQRWNQAFVNFGHSSPERVYAERLKMAKEISLDSFDLKDTATRIAIDDSVIELIRSAFNNVKASINTVQHYGDAGSTTYGYGGSLGGGMARQQQQSYAPGTAFNGQNAAW